MMSGLVPFLLCPLLQGPCVRPLRPEANFLRQTPSTQMYIIDIAVFWLVVAPISQVEDCVVFVCVFTMYTNSLHASKSLKYIPQVPVRHRFENCAMCQFLAFFRLFLRVHKYIVLHRITQPPVLVHPISNMVSRCYLCMSFVCNIRYVLTMSAISLICTPESRLL